MVLKGTSEGISTDYPQSFHPLVAEYFSKLGDMDILPPKLEIRPK